MIARKSRRGGARRGSRPAAASCLTPILVLLLASGCAEKATPAGARKPRSEENLELPKEVPGLQEAGLEEEDNPGAAEVMVKAAYDRQEKETYHYESRFPAGTITGSCRFVQAEGMSFPPEEPIDLDGKYAVSNPEPKETDYYKTIELKKPRWFVQHGRGEHAWYQPTNVVIMLRNITRGRHPPLDRPVMMFRQGGLTPGDASNNGGNNIQCGALHERAQFTTWDEHPSHVVVTRHDTGKVFFEQIVRYAHGRKDTLNTAGHLKYKPEFATTPPFRQTGTYTVTDTRHPWIKGYLFSNSSAVCNGWGG